MAINYTSLLALIQPVDGTEVSVWGDDVNNGVSSILDVAVAGTQNITTDANVTLTITQATSSGTNLSGTSAQYAILLLSGARTATRTITLPASSKTYTVMNSTTGGYAQTVGGLTIAVGEVAKIVYNISTSAWVKASTFSGAGTFSTVTATAATTASSNLGAYNYGTLNFSDTGIVQSAQTSVNSYFQNVIQNTSNGTAASAEFIAYNDQGTATTNYATVGINSSGYSGTGSINAPGYGYFLTASTDLVLGTIGANGIHFTTNSSATDALAISSAGAVSLPGGTANGVAYLNGSKVLTTGSALTFDGTNLGLSSGNIFVPTTSGVFFSSPGTFVNGVYGVGTNNVAFNANGSEQMRLTSTGLGIGTSSPSYKLDVNGSGNIIRAINSSTSSAFILSTNSGASSILVMGNESTTAGSSATGSASYAGLLFTTGSKPLQFGTNSTIQATLDTSGNLGLGVTPSAWSAYKAIQVNTGLTAYSSGTGGDSGLTHNAYYNGANWIYIGTGYATQYDMYLGAHRWYSAGSGSAGGTISFTQAMTLDNSGNLLVGATSAFNTSRATFTSQANNTIAAVQGTAGGYCFVSSALSNGGTYYHCSFTENGTQRGSITSNGSVTAYNITSDQRLKENIVDADTASNLIDALQVRQFDWKSDGSHQRYGFVAQELVAVAPEAVHQPADPEEMMAVDYSKLVPMLVKEIQSLRARLKAANIA